MISAREFQAKFGVRASVSAEAPGRVNLLGEHTDYNDGYVLPATIPQTTQVSIAKGGHEYQVYSANLGEMLRFGRAGKLQSFARYVGGCIRALESNGHHIPYLRMSIASTVPIGAGLSSSAALEVAVLRAVNALLRLGLDSVRIARLAQLAEIQSAGVTCGIMDQMASSLAIPGSMLFLDTLTLARRVLPLPAGAEILVVDSGIPRALNATAYNTRRKECAEAAHSLGVKSLREISDVAAVLRLPSPLRERARHVVSENARVVAALSADAARFGELMKASHQSLRDDYAVSIAALDRLVEHMLARDGVFGARMTGAGFGGACVALVKEGQAAAIGKTLTSSALDPGGLRRVIVPPPARGAERHRMR